MVVVLTQRLFSYRYELQFQLLEAFPDDPPSVDASWQSKGVEDLREAIRRLAAQKGRVDLGRGRTGLKTSNLVQGEVLQL